MKEEIKQILAGKLIRRVRLKLLIWNFIDDDKRNEELIIITSTNYVLSTKKMTLRKAVNNWK